MGRTRSGITMSGVPLFAWRNSENGVIVLPVLDQGAGSESRLRHKIEAHTIVPGVALGYLFDKCGPLVVCQAALSAPNERRRIYHWCA